MFASDLFDGHTAFVSGAAQGIGAEIALSLAEHGADVAVNDLDGDGAADVADSIRSLGNRALGLEGDVTNPDRVDEMVETATEELGTIDLAVNNAGTNTGGAIVDLDPDDWDKVMDVNAKGTFLVSKEIGRRLVDSGESGSILNISSIAGIRAHTEAGSYTASKAAIIKLTEQLALELAQDRIRVNCICPGLIWTEASDSVYSDDELREQRRGWVPLKSIGEPDDVATAAMYLLSPANNYVTGESLFVDGGAQCVGLNLVPGRSSHPR
jgi:3-oxoacyl-[acyl-carrier protein] reductase